MRQFSAVRQLFPTLLFIASSILGLTACGDADFPTIGDTGKLSVQLKDAPGDIKHAVVTISEVYLNGAPEGRVVLTTTPFTIDLTTLASQATPFLENLVVPNGRYSQLRFVISGAYIEVENADATTSIYASSNDYSGLPLEATVDGPLSISLEAQIGSPVALPGGSILIRGDERNILVDFDMKTSFIRTGSFWRLDPLLSSIDLAVASTAIVSVELDPSVTLPTIDGRQLTLGDFSAVLTRTPNFRVEKRLTDSDANQIFTAEFGLLQAATYSVTLTGPTGVVLTTTPLTPVQLPVAASETKTQMIRILEVSVVE